MSHKKENILTLLAEEEEKNPHRVIFSYLDAYLNIQAERTYHDLWQRSRAIGAILQQHISPGDRVLLLFPSGLDFVDALLGCIISQFIAVPLPIPRWNGKDAEKVIHVIENCHPKIILTDQNHEAKIKKYLAERNLASQIQVISSEDIATSEEAAWKKPDNISGDTLAFLQFTSGSTGQPKGVKVSHKNIFLNINLFSNSMNLTHKSRVLSWLPHYHDMGLIGCILGPIVRGFHCYLLNSNIFIQQPSSWLIAISKYKATVSGGPNFAFNLCNQKFKLESNLELDLSSLEVLFNGAEPISFSTMENFYQTFAKYGLKKEALFPCYGMAEATLFISGGPYQEGVSFVTLSREALKSHRVAPAKINDHQSIVSCGQVPKELDIKIVHPETEREVSQHEIGEIWIRGDSISHGYYELPDKTQETFHNLPSSETPSKLSPNFREKYFLRTGDLGFIQNQHLFITGRLKDLIIYHGVNIYPQDLESCVEKNSLFIKPGSVAAFQELKFATDEQRIILVVEVQRNSRHENLFEETKNILEKLSQEFILPIYDFIWIQPGQTKKTSSGKIQRQATKLAIERNELEIIFAWNRADKNQERKLTSVNSSPSITGTPISNNKNKSDILSDLKSWLVKNEDWSESKLQEDTPLILLGMDSVTAINLNHYIHDKYHISIPNDFMFDKPTLNKLAQYIQDR